MRDGTILQRSNEKARKARNEERKKNERSKNRGTKLLLERNFQKFFEIINEVYFFNLHLSRFILLYFEIDKSQERCIKQTIVEK